MDGIISETPPELLKATVQTPAALHLFEVNKNGEKLEKEQWELFHHLVAKLLYLTKRSRLDVMVTTAFLTTWVQSPDQDNWEKLGRVLTYLRNTSDLYLTLEASQMHVIQWWIDASFAVHPNMKSHTGAVMSIGKGRVINMSNKQKLNTRSSTEAELVSVNDAMALVLWMRMFLIEQGFTVVDNLIHQDNQSTILLARNGTTSSGKEMRHIEIRYYLVTDNVAHGTVDIRYCPTEDMVAHFHTKPLQGSQFRVLRRRILNLEPVTDGMQECVGTGDPMDVRTNRTMSQDHPSGTSPSQ